jgi:quinol---cytochrome-c reductase cytochrome b subunit
VPEVFWPSIVLPGLTFAALYAWPFVEAKVTGDHEEYHLLDRPSDRPVRSAIGAGAITFYGVLMVAGAQDIVAQELGADIETAVDVLRTLTLVLPFVVGLVTWRVCREIRASGRTRREEASTEPPVADYEDAVG